MEEARRSLVSGQVEWTVEPAAGPAKRLHYVSRYARNGDMLFEHRGDDDGWTMFDPASGEPTSKYPQVIMHNADGFWRYQRTGVTAMGWKRDGRPNPWVDDTKDIRYVGVTTTSASMRPDMGLAAILKTLSGVQFESWEEREGTDGGIVVTAHYDSDVDMTWEIDRERGWNPRRVVVTAGGEEIWEVRNELDKIDDVWFPVETTYSTNGSPTETIRVQHATFNRDTDAARLVPGDMGMEPGTQIAAQNVPNETGKPLVWNGDELSSWDRWMEDVKSKRRDWGPTFRRMWAGEEFSSPYDTEAQRQRRKIQRASVGLRLALASHESLWADYVRRFIAHYQLNADQQERARQILQSCQELAEGYLHKHRAEFTQLETAALAAQESEDRTRLERLSARIRQLREPIERIFRERLKPRLDKLPTRAQRKNAGKLN